MFIGYLSGFFLVCSRLQSNIAHSIADDYFPIYQMQRDWLGWDANAEAEILRALEGHPSDPGKDAPKFDENAVPPLPPGLSITANLIFLDRAGYWDFSGRILRKYMRHTV